MANHKNSSPSSKMNRPIRNTADRHAGMFEITLGCRVNHVVMDDERCIADFTITLDGDETNHCIMFRFEDDDAR